MYLACEGVQNLPIVVDCSEDEICEARSSPSGAVVHGPYLAHAHDD